MDVPESLSERVYLLAHRASAWRETLSVGELGQVLAAAALTELYLADRIVDAGGRVQAAARPARRDPMLGVLLDRIAASRPRTWEHWVNAGARGGRRAVRDQLAAGGWVRVEPARLAGLIPSARVSVVEPAVVAELGGRLEAALRPDRLPERVEPWDAALVAIAAAGELRSVLPGPRRRAARARIAELTSVAGPAAPALRRVLRRRRYAHS
jgi:hypothetical protein